MAAAGADEQVEFADKCRSVDVQSRNARARPVEIALPRALQRARPLAGAQACGPAALVLALVVLAPTIGLGQSRLAPAWTQQTPLEAPAVASVGPQLAQAQPPDGAHPATPSWGGRYHPRYGRWWPGQTLPPDAPASVITDPEHYHLRLAPAGYVWLLCDGDLVLASSTSRLIVEVIPGGGG